MALGGRSVDGPDGERAHVMAAVDGDAPDRRLVIADTGVEGAWLSVPLADARPLVEWR